MIEVALLQRFTLFLGQPIYTLAVVLASLLIFSGIGSYAVSRFTSPSRPRFIPIILAVLAVIAVTAYGTHSIFSATLGLSLASRIAVAILMIAPLGIVLGMPFPACLRLVAEQAPVLVPWAWGVNGFFTVIGSAAAMIVGMILGFNAVLACAGGCYLVALLAITLCRRGSGGRGPGGGDRERRFRQLGFMRRMP
jgi:MFS family permease